MARFMFAAALAFAAVAACSAGWLTAGTEPNKFIVTYGLLPDPFHSHNFFNMPRTAYEALNSGWDIYDVDFDETNTRMKCRGEDYRVCLRFDKRGNIAGIQLSMAKKDLDAANLPIDIAGTPEWKLTTMKPIGEVYTATVFFQSAEDLANDGIDRVMTDDILTIPDGFWILQTDKDGKETGRLHVKRDESEAKASGFGEQACFVGMGKHYFQDLTPQSKCEDHRPFFLLYGPKTNKLNGFGFTMYGKPSTSPKGRNWFEAPPAAVAKKIAPNSPECLTEFINKYGMFTMHVYFVEKPWLTSCWW